MGIKLIAVDMDGTFLRDNDTYDQQRFSRQLEQLKTAGIHFVAASGSQLSRLQNQFSSLAPQIDFISENGSIVYSDGQVLSVSQIPEDALSNTLQIIKDHFQIPIASTTVTGLHGAYIDAKEPQAIFDLKNRYYAQLARVENLLEYSTNKFHDQIVKVGLSFAEDANAPAQIKLLKNLLPSQLASLNSGFNTELIGLAEVTKRSGLAHLQAKYGVNDDEVMTFGDNENDLAMLQMTPYGYAMQNASDNIRRAVARQAPTNNEDGVLTIIDRLLNQLRWSVGFE